MLPKFIFEKIDDWIVEKDHRLRNHFGFSGVGDDDEYKQWMNFHWCLPSTFDGRMLRLFDFGNRIEDQVVENIRESKVISIASHSANGKQIEASLFGGHFAGSCDGLVRGLEPDTDETYLLEIKSANDKRWKELDRSEDYEGWSETYRWQIHAYMGGLGLKKCLVVVVNKNDSRIYSQIIDFNPRVWELAKERAERVIFNDEPEGNGVSEKDWRIKNEPKIYQDIYFKRRLPASANCRNCTSSKPLQAHGATWICKRNGNPLTIEEQAKGCSLHLWKPCLVNANQIPEESSENSITYQAGIVKFSNVIASEKGKYKYTSPELRELSKTQFDAEFMAKGEIIRADMELDASITSVDIMDENNIPI